MIQVFVQSLFIGYSGAVMPGSLLTYTLEKSLRRGVRAGILISIGHALLELLLIALILFGLDKFLTSHIVQIAVGLLGGGFLLYLGGDMLYQTLRNRVSISTEQEDQRSGGLVLNGALISASNPYFIIWWTVVGLGMILSAYHAYGVWGVLVFYFGHILADFTWYITVSGIVGRTRRFINQNIYRVLIGVLGLALLVFGGGFVLSAIRAWIAL